MHKSLDLFVQKMKDVEGQDLNIVQWINALATGGFEMNKWPWLLTVGVDMFTATILVSELIFWNRVKPTKFWTTLKVNGDPFSGLPSFVLCPTLSVKRVRSCFSASDLRS